MSPATVFATQQAVASSTAKEIHFGAIQGIYPNVSRNDGRMALELLMQRTIVDKSYPYAVKLSFLDPAIDIPNAIERGGYHFITLSSIDFFKHCKAVRLVPILIPSKSDQLAEQLLLLVGKNHSLTTFQQNEERTLIVESGSSGDLSIIWLDTVLLEKGLPVSRKYFTHIRRVSKPARAIIPVFFNQADACVITRNAFDVIKELNPQMNQRVKALHRSKRLVRLMICATAKASPKDIQILIRESVNMAKNTEAQQAMTILQIKRFLPALTEDLAATEALLKRHNPIKETDPK